MNLILSAHEIGASDLPRVGGKALALAALALCGPGLSPGALRPPTAREPLPAGELLAYSWPLLGTSMLLFLFLCHTQPTLLASYFTF